MRIIDKNTDYYDYIQNLYPDDSTEEGRILRLRQQYFLFKV